MPARCGRRYVGASAKGNGGRYRCYVCFSRPRYGRDACDADRLPADELEEAILGQLLSVLEKEPVIREAIASEARRVGESLDRYFRAFEEGTMPESACGPRITEFEPEVARPASPPSGAG